MSMNHGPVLLNGHSLSLTNAKLIRLCLSVDAKLALETPRWSRGSGESPACSMPLKHDMVKSLSSRVVSGDIVESCVRG